MSLQIRPASHLEDQVVTRVLGNIPTGQFYLRAQYILPIYNGTGITPFILTGTRGHIVKVLLNTKLVTRVGLVADKERFVLQLKQAPEVNTLEVVDEVTGDTDSISVVITNYATVHTGASKDYFRKVYLPLLYQRWSLKSEWSARVTEFLFKYHSRFPDTQALRVLSTRLMSRATWNELPSEEGIRSAVGALCCSDPAVVALSNSRLPNVDFGLIPLLSPQADYAGWEFNCWFPDMCSTREWAFGQMARNLPDFYHIKSFNEDNIQLLWQDTHTPINKFGSDCNLRGVFRLIGALDYWQVFIDLDLDMELVWRIYSSGFDSIVTHSLGGGRYWDIGSLLDSGEHWDTSDPWAEKWDGLAVVPSDVGETLDSQVKRAVCLGEVRVDPGYASDWEYTSLSVSASTGEAVTNPLHGGAPTDYVYNPATGL